MKWLFKKKDSFKQADWNDITLEKYYKIVELLQVQDEYTVLNIIDLVYGVNGEDIPITELKKYKIDFISKQIPHKDKVPSKLTINGHKYSIDTELTKVSATQYVDFCNYTQGKDIKYEDALSVFIIPSEHAYNDGYDMSIVKKDIMELSMVDIATISQFFFLQFKLFASLFQLYLSSQLKEMEEKATPEVKEKIEKILEELAEVDLQSSVVSLI